MTTNGIRLATAYYTALALIIITGYLVVWLVPNRLINTNNNKRSAERVCAPLVASDNYTILLIPVL